MVGDFVAGVFEMDQHLINKHSWGTALCVCVTWNNLTEASLEWWFRLGESS
jgi:hypothetical protein